MVKRPKYCSFAEAELTDLHGIPISIVHQGRVLVETTVSIECVVHNTENTHYATALEVTEQILNQKASDLPNAMRNNPRNCSLFICTNQEKHKLSPEDTLNIFFKDLALETSTLLLSDELTGTDGVSCNLDVLSVKTK